jgi:hypothetical protein
MGRKSLYSAYKSNVKYNLVRTFCWPNQKALDWLNSNQDYIKAMYATDSPATVTAEEINRMKKYADS